MADVQTPIDTLRERLTGLLADWGAEFSMVLKELDESMSESGSKHSPQSHSWLDGVKKFFSEMGQGS